MRCEKNTGSAYRQLRQTVKNKLQGGRDAERHDKAARDNIEGTRRHGRWQIRTRPSETERHTPVAATENVGGKRERAEGTGNHRLRRAEENSAS